MANLSAAFVGKVVAGNVAPGRYRDQRGLILNVSSGGASWLWRYKRNGKSRDLGLGPLAVVGLSKARELAADHRLRLKANRLDPIAQRREQRAEAQGSITFDKAAAAYIAENAPGWRNPKHRAQWASTLKTYCGPKIGATPLREISTDAVLGILRPLWKRAPETGSRVRGRVEAIWDWGKAQGFCQGENPARWRGHLAMILPAKGKVRKARHHPAVTVDDAPTLFARLQRPARLGDGEAPGNAACAVMFALLTASRPGGPQLARWPEMDIKTATWTVPESRMKGAMAHRVPLCREALDILKQMDKRRDPASDYVFPGGRRGRPLSLASMQKALRVAMANDLKTGCGGKATVHGSSRSTFDDWCHEKKATVYPSILVDRALAHGSKDMSIAAYRRSELLDGRRPLMRDWGSFLSG